MTNANDKYFEPKPVFGFEQPQARGRDVNSLEAGTNISACTQVRGLLARTSLGTVVIGCHSEGLDQLLPLHLCVVVCLHFLTWALL